MQPRSDLPTAGWVHDPHRGRMPIDDPPHRPIVGQDQDPADEARSEAESLCRDDRSESLLDIDGPVRFFEGAERRLHFPDDDRQGWSVRAEDVDRPSFAVPREAHLRGNLPASSPENDKRLLDKGRVAPVDEAVCCRSAPPRRQPSPPVDGQEHATNAVDLDDTRPAILNGDDVTHWDACSRGKGFLRDADFSPDRAENLAEPLVLHPAAGCCWNKLGHQRRIAASAYPGLTRATALASGLPGQQAMGFTMGGGQETTALPRASESLVMGSASVAADSLAEGDGTRAGTVP